MMITYLTLLMSGVLVTIKLVVLSMMIGFTLALVFTLVKQTECRLLKKLIDFFVFFIRGTPVLVQLYLIYYGFSQFAALRDTFFWVLFKSPTSCAVIALAINTACYTTVLFQGAINTVPSNQRSAALAIGMSKWLAFRRIVLPQALRAVLPAYSNEVIMVLKSTSLASTITLMDVLGVTQELISQTYHTISCYLLAGVIYLVLNGIIMYIFNRLFVRLRY